MTDRPQQLKGRDGILSSLNMAIEGLNLAKEVASITPAKAVFGSVSILLTMIRDTMDNEQEYVDLGLFCADICEALKQGMDGKSPGDLSKSVCDAINKLTTTVAEMQNKIIKRSGRHRVSRFIHARNDKDTIAAWKSDLNRVLQVFNTELAMNTYTTVSGIHHNMLKVLGGQGRVTQDSAPGELPPPPPRFFFGRDEMIEKIVGFAQQSTPIALIGAGGIGKTSIILAALHDDRIKQRFGIDRRFIRCDEFPASHTYFLRRLSKVIGAGVENPEDLSLLRPFLSSKEMIIVLDNAESILDPQGANAQDIYAAVDELSRFSNVCLCITSRIFTIPTGCEVLEIPTLSMEAAHDTFYRIYKNNRQSGPIDGILEQLDFHPLSITLLATTAQYNRWDADRLTTEWEGQRTGVLHAQHTRSLATTIELSLTSPMFQELGPDAHGLLEVVAFFPQGVNEKNVNWLFPTVPNGRNIFDKFCALSLTYRSNGYITMLAPLRDYLCPKDPASSPLLATTKECYIARFSEDIHPDHPKFEESRWIMSEDVNIEHLLDVFTSVDTNSEDIWIACARFIYQLHMHKPRLLMLGPKIESLPDDHPVKARCLRELSWLSDSLGNLVERKRFLTHALKIWREQENTYWIAMTVSDLSDTNRQMRLLEEGIQQAKEAAEMFEQLGKTAGQAECLIDLAWLLYEDDQLDDAEEAVSRAIDLLPEKGEQRRICLGHRVLGNIYGSKGETEKAIHSFEVALRAAFSISLYTELFWIHFALAQLFVKVDRLDDAHVHIEHARPRAGNDPYLLARASQMHAEVWEAQQNLEGAKAEASRALDVFKKLGATNDVEYAERFLQRIDTRTGQSDEPDEPGNDGSQNPSNTALHSHEPPDPPQTARVL